MLEPLEDRNLLSAGTLDVTFGGTGQVVTPYQFVDGTTRSAATAMAVAVQGDGKIIVAGDAYTSSPVSGFTSLMLARYNLDGSLDTTFGTGGIVIADLVPGNDQITAVVIDSAGKIVVTDSGLLVRYNTDGNLDTTFGPDGAGTAGADFGISALALASDGKLVVGGGRFQVARLSPDGSPDTSFAPTQAPTDPNDPFFFASVGALAITPEGDIEIAGTATYPAFSGNDYFAMARYTSAGLLDTTFGNEGKVLSPLGVRTEDVAFQDDGGIVFVGRIVRDFGLTRYNTDGSLDTTFGPSGTGLVSTDFGNSDDLATAVTVQANGKTVVVGRTATVFLPDYFNFAVARYNSDGSLDTTFGPNGSGKVIVDFTSRGDFATGVALQPDGRVVVVGGTSTSVFDSGFALVRYLGDPSTIEGSDFVFSTSNASPLRVPDAGTSLVTATLGTDLGLLTLFQTTGLTFSAGDGTNDANMVFTGTSAAINAALDGLKLSTMDSGTAVVSLISDDQGNTTTESVTVTVKNLNPVIASLASNTPGPSDAAINGDVTIAGVFSDAGLGDTHHAVIDWGDGTQTSLAEADIDQVSRTFTAGHHYASGGTFTISVTLHDDDGGTDTRTATAYVTVTVVTIDVRPQSINLNNNGVLPVVIYTTADFDAAQVNVASVLFANAHASHSTLEDVDGDGDLDLVLHFRTQDTNLRELYEQLVADDVNEDGELDSNHQEISVSLTGQTAEGAQFIGSGELDAFFSGKALRELLDELAAAGLI